MWVIIVYGKCKILKDYLIKYLFPFLQHSGRVFCSVTNYSPILVTGKCKVLVCGRLCELEVELSGGAVLVRQCLPDHATVSSSRLSPGAVVLIRWVAPFFFTTPNALLEVVILPQKWNAKNLLCSIYVLKNYRLLGTHICILKKWQLLKNQPKYICSWMCAVPC